MTPAETWRRIGPVRVSATTALVGAERLLAGAVAVPTLIWWTVARPALVLGRGSRVVPDAAACAAAGVEVVRRSSGGGPVLWGPDLLAFDVVVPRDHALHGADVTAAYRWIGEAAADALRDLGADARALAPAEARGHARELGEVACYAGRSPWEVVVGAGKAVGLSQVRRRAGLLLQAGIVTGPGNTSVPKLVAVPDDVDPDALARALAPPPLPVTDVGTLVDAFEAAVVRRTGAVLGPREDGAP